MVLVSLLPIGLAQTAASIDQGLWYARSAEFLQQPIIENLRWLRMIGDTVFLGGVGSLVWFAVGLKTGWSLEKKASAVDKEQPSLPLSSETEAVGA